MNDFNVNAHLNLDVKQFNTQLNQAVNNMTGTFQKAGTIINRDLSGATFNNITNVIQKTSQAAQRATPQIKTFGDAFKSAFTNIPKTLGMIMGYSMVNTVLNSITDGFKETISAVSDFDKSLVELQKVTTLTSSELSGFKETVYELGEELSSTLTDVTDAVTTFVKTGASLEESTGLAETAIMMKRTSDEAIEATEAADALVAVMKAFDIQAENSIHVGDAINNVSANFAISSGQIEQNISKVAATMAVGNTSFEQTLGLMTAITEETRNASQAAQALKTIGQRLRGVGEDAEEGLTAKLQGAFDELGINIQILNSQTGEMASTYDILYAMASRWDDLTEAQRQYIGEMAAGKLRITQFNALMHNFGNAISATDAALDSAGVTMQQFEVYEDGIEGRTNKLIEQFQVFANKLINSDLIKGVISLGTAILKFANTDVGQLIVKLGLLAGAIAVVRTVVKSLAFQDLILNIGIIGTKLGALLAGLNPVVALIGVLAVGIGALVLTVKNGASTFDNLNAKLEKTNAQLSETQSKLADVKSEYDTLKSKPFEELTAAERDRLGYLNSQLIVLEKQTEELQKQKQAEGREAFDAFTAESDERTVTTGREVSHIIHESGEVVYKDVTEGVYDYIDGLTTLNGVISENINIMADEANALKEYQAQGYELSEEQEKFIEQWDILSGAYSTSKYAAEEYGDTVGGLVASAMNTLTDAMQQQNSTGHITAETANKLKALYPQLADKIHKVGNEWQIETSALVKLTNAEHTEAGMASTLAAAASKLVSSEVAKANAFDGTTKSVLRQLYAQKALYEQTLENIRLSGGEVGRGSTVVQKLNSIKSLISEIESYNPNIGSSGGGGYYGGGGGSSSGGSSTSTSTTKDTTALKNQAEVIKGAAAYMVDQIEAEINVLKDAKKASDEYYDDKIRELNEANDALEDQIALENALKALEDAKKRKVLVYKDGQFQYDQDTSAINEAQKELNSVIREQALDAQIKQLEEEKDATAQFYDDQISALEEYSDNWSNLSQKWTEEQDKLYAQQVFGAKMEGDVWQTRIENAAAFVSEYLNLMSTIAKVEAGTMTVAQGQEVAKKSASNFSKGLSNTSGYKTTVLSNSSASSALTSGVAKYSSGTIGSSYIPTSSAVSSNSGNGTTVINISNVSLPNVSNANEFVSELQNFKIAAYQAAT